MSDGAFQKNKQPYGQNPDLGPDEYDIDLSGLDMDDDVESAREGSEQESYIRELRHREEKVLAGELQEPYGVDEILETAGLQASGQMPPLPQTPKAGKVSTPVQGEYAKQVDEVLARIEAGVAEATTSGRDVQEVVDHFTDELGVTPDVDALYDRTVSAADVTVPVIVDTPKEAMQTLRLIEDSLESETLKPDEIPGLHKILREIADKYSNDLEIKKVALDLSNYAHVVRTAHAAQGEIPVYETEAKHKARTEKAKREATAKQVAYFAQKGDFEQAYGLASEAAKDDPEHFRYAQAVMAKLAGKHTEAEKIFATLTETPDIKRHLKELQRINSYKKLIAAAYEGGDLATAMYAAERGKKQFPLQFAEVYDKLAKELSDYKVLRPDKSSDQARTDSALRKVQLLKRKNELAAEEKKREEEARQDEARKAELDDQRKKREEEKSKLDEEAEELEKEAKKLDEIELPLWQTIVKVPITNPESAKEALQRVKDALQVRKLTEQEEIELYKFLQEVERRFPTSTELDEDITDITRILKETQEEEDDEAPYRVFPEAPEVPVEYRKPKKEAAEEKETEEEEDVEEKETEEPAVEPVKATEESEPAAPEAPAEPTAPAKPAEAAPSEGETEEKGESKEKPVGLGSIFSFRSVAEPEPLELSKHEPEKKSESEEELPPIAGAFDVRPEEEPKAEEPEAEEKEGPDTKPSEELPDKTEEPDIPTVSVAEPEAEPSELESEEELVPIRGGVFDVRPESETPEPAAAEAEEVAEEVAEEKPESEEELPPIAGGFKVTAQPEEAEFDATLGERLGGALGSVKVAKEATPEAEEKAPESIDELYEAIKESGEFKELLELVAKLKANPELGKDIPWVDQLRNMPEMLPAENGHKYLIEQILKDLDQKDPEHLRLGIGIIVDAANDLEQPASEEEEAPPTTPSPSLETGETEPVAESEPVEAPVVEEAEEEAPVTAKSAEPESQAAGSEASKEGVEDIDKTVEELLEAVKEDPNYQELARIIKILRTSPRRLDEADKNVHAAALRRLFGTEDQTKIREAISKGDDEVLKAIMAKGYAVFDGGEIDGKRILKPLLEGLEGEKTVDAGKRTCLELLSRLQNLKIEEGTGEAEVIEEEPATLSSAELSARGIGTEGAEETPEEVKAPDVSVVEPSVEAPKAEEAKPVESAEEAPASEPSKEPESTPESAPIELKSAESSEKKEEVKTELERADIPQAMMDAIEACATGDEAKKKRLLDLWEAAKGKGQLHVDGKRDKKLESLVNDELDHIAGALKDPMHASQAPRWLSYLLESTKKASVEFPSSEDIALDNLATDVVDLLEDDKEFAVLKSRLESIFDILKIDPEDFPRNARKLEDMQEDMKELLLKEIPAKIGMKECSSVEEFYDKFRKLRTRGQMQALEKLNDMIANDKGIEKVIRLFQRLTKSKHRKKSGGGTPPAAPPTGGSTAPAATPTGASSPAAAPVAPNVGPSGAPLPSTPMGMAPSAAVSTASAAPAMRLSADEQKRYGSPEVLMKHLGFELDKSNPASVAIRTLLRSEFNKDWPVAGMSMLKDLHVFLKSGEYMDEIDEKNKGKTKEDLKSELTQIEADLNALNVRIRAEDKAYRKGYEAQQKAKQKLKSESEALNEEWEKKYEKLTPEQKQALSREEQEKMESLDKQRTEVGAEYQKLVENPFHSKVSQLYAEKSKLENQRIEKTEGLKRLAQKKGKETVHYRTPEQLLGMINLYFNKKALPEGETPDYAKVMEDTQQRIDKARDEQNSTAGKWYNRLAVWNYVKPTLTHTLETVFEEDKTFSKLGPEEAKSLAKAASKKGGVEAWLRELEGTEKHKMETLVPTLIGYLSTAINAGGSAGLNTASLPSSRKLLSALRKVAHEYSIEQAEKVGGTSLQKMNAYFAQLNGINKKSSQIKQKIIWDNVNTTLAKRLGIPITAAGAGVGGALALSAGATALVAMGPLAVAAAGVGAVGVGAGALSTKLKDPEKRAKALSIAKRGIVAGALGAAAIGSAPIVGIAALGAGLLHPEIWKNKGKIAKTGVRGAWGYTGVVLGLATMGLAFRNPRFTRFFGLTRNK